MPASGTSEPQRCGGDQALGGREKFKKKYWVGHPGEVGEPSMRPGMAWFGVTHCDSR